VGEYTLSETQSNFNPKIKNIKSGGSPQKSYKPYFKRL